MITELELVRFFDRAEIELTGWQAKLITQVLNTEGPIKIYWPQREDAIATWLKTGRDSYLPDEGWSSETTDDMHKYFAVDGLLDEYRERADFGLSLDEELKGFPEHGS